MGAAAPTTIAAVADAVVAARGRGWFRRHGHGSHKGERAPADAIEAAAVRVWYVPDILRSRPGRACESDGKTGGGRMVQ